MKNLILAVFVMINISSCNIFGESEIDNDFIFSLPIDSLMGWFDSTDSTMMSLTGANIDIWNNKVVGVNATCNTQFPTFVSDVLNGYGGVNFNTAGITCSMVHTSGSAEFTVVAAMDIKTNSNSLAIFDDFIIDTTSTLVGMGAATCVSPEGLFGPQVLSYRFINNTIVEVYKDGHFLCEADASGRIFSTPSSNIGLNFNDNSQIYEIIFYERWLSNAELDAAEMYLMARWGI